MPSPCLAEAVAVHGHLRPHATALVTSDRTVSYGELGELTQSFRHSLIELNLPAGSTICVPAHKSPETIALLLAAFLEGLVVLAPAPDLGAAALARLAQQARATHVLTASAIDALTADAVQPDEQEAAGFAAPDPARTCLLLTTSGSTGTPKIVPIAATGFDAFAAWATQEFSLTDNEVALSYAPLNFDLALLDIWTFLQLGAQVVLVDQGRATDAPYVESLVADVTFIQGVPMLYRLLTEAGTAFAPVREVIFTGDSVPDSLLKPVSAAFPNARFHNIFGCTETNDSFIHEVDPATLTGKMPIGRPIAGTDALIRDGELLVATPFQTDGYLNTALNAEVFEEIDGRTFYRTGDLVTQDDDGLYSLQGRADWQVKVRGVRTNLQEVERVISAHPDVIEAVVVPLPDEQAGVRLHAHVSRRHSSALTGLRLRTHAGQHLPRHAIPTSVHVTDDPMPRTSTGKPDRNLIKSNRLKEIHS
ncbi:AMP-binding protein [Kribbella sp. NPDC056951]|uniref:AMP-binding protein n=1 Tax=Kribbella sp. NPDC056951 TaxID=3345978 RepID=UPI00363B826A